jgi:hypothetical protein
VLTPLVRIHHRDAGMHLTQDFRLRRRVEPILKPPKPLVQPAPETFTAVEVER